MTERNMFFRLYFRCIASPSPPLPPPHPSVCAAGMYLCYCTTTWQCVVNRAGLTVTQQHSFCWWSCELWRNLTAISSIDVTVMLQCFVGFIWDGRKILPAWRGHTKTVTFFLCWTYVLCVSLFVHTYWSWSRTWWNCFLYIHIISTK